jgi:acetylornithine deacetylase/succinyl-diaminopimelate desuccinylase-like protein
MASAVDETVALLQTLIRNQCVNDGTPDSGGERRNADLLQTYLEGAGLEVERFTSRGDRTSVVARIEGTDPTAPKLCLMGHTDVVPVSADSWSEDPFGGELIDGEVWGRGALDMFCLTASMAVVMRQIARGTWRPRGDLIYFGVADEEGGGQWGAEWMVDHHWDAIACDYVLTELGGFWSADGESVTIHTAEKGLAARALIIEGTPGHGAIPYGSDNAIVKAAEVVRRISALRPATSFDERWKSRVRHSGLDLAIQEGLLDPGRLEDTLDALPVREALGLHASSHTTLSCNMIGGGRKLNIIPDQVRLEVDIRTLPGVTGPDVDRLLADALGELASSVRVEPLWNDEATASVTDTPLWKSLEHQIRRAFPASKTIPSLFVGATDGRFFRRKGTVAYGAGLFSPATDTAAIAARFHGNNERIDIESLELCTDLWDGVTREVLG